MFFAQFLEASGHFEALCREAPLLHYTSSNAPDRCAVLATLVLGILAGCRRFAHLTALRFDEVVAGLLGVRTQVSADRCKRKASPALPASSAV